MKIFAPIAAELGRGVGQQLATAFSNRVENGFNDLTTRIADSAQSHYKTLYPHLTSKKRAADSEARNIAREIKATKKNWGQFYQRTDFPLCTTIVKFSAAGTITDSRDIKNGRVAYFLLVPMQSTIKEDAGRMLTCSAPTLAYAFDALDPYVTDTVSLRLYNNGRGSRYVIKKCHSKYVLWNRTNTTMKVTQYMIKKRVAGLYPSQDNDLQMAGFLTWALIPRFKFTATAGAPDNRMDRWPIMFSDLGKGWRQRVNVANEAVPEDATTTATSKETYNMSLVSPFLSPYQSPNFVKNWEIVGERDYVIGPEGKVGLEMYSPNMEQWDYNELIDSSTLTGAQQLVEPMVTSAVAYSPNVPSKTIYWLLSVQIMVSRRQTATLAAAGTYVPFDVPPRYDQNNAGSSNVRTVVEYQATGPIQVLEDVKAVCDHVDVSDPQYPDICLIDNRIAGTAAVTGTAVTAQYFNGPVPITSTVAGAVNEAFPATLTRSTCA